MSHPAAQITSYRHRPLAFLLQYVRRHGTGHAVIGASVIIAVFASVFSQYGLKRLIDVISHGPAGAGPAVWTAFGLLCALIAADNFTWRIGGWVAARAFVRVTGDLRADLFAHLTGHAPSYFADRMPGTLASRITATANAAFQIENSATWNVFPPLLAVSISIGLIAGIAPTMAASLGLLALAMAWLIFQLARRGTPIHRTFATEAASVDGTLVDVISNMQVVRAFGASLREQRRLSDQLEVEMGARRRSMLYLEKLRLLHAALTALITAGLLGWTIVLWQHGQASIGDVVLISSLGFTILHGTRDLAVALVDLTQYVARLGEALESLLVAHEMPDAADAQKLVTAALEHPGADAGCEGISFQHVHFAYPGRATMLPDLSLTIPVGQRVGLVGASGAGKSTIMSLLQRFHDPDSGVVRICGQDIAHVTADSLRAALAIVPQDIALFNRSVLDNIAYARPDATRAEIVRAADLALCRNFIEALPQGFDTVVGNRGALLSGGQRQRIAIARALLKDAPILLLDEATSALDSESEHLIQQALERLMVGRTVIAIAHRLSTLRSFDRIIVLDHGTIVDDGPPALLSARPGPYRDLLRTQAMHTDIAA